MLEHRVHFLLDPDRFDRLRREARRSNTSVGALIREAIDQRFKSSTSQRRQKATEAILAARPMKVPFTPGELRRELDDAHDRIPK